MSEAPGQMVTGWWRTLLDKWAARLRQREDQIFLVLTLLVGALVGLAVVAFIVLTERLGGRFYPAGGAAWRRALMPVIGSLAMGYLLFRYFPEARGSGVPQTKAALFAREGHITLGTALGKSFCTSATLASGIPLGREGPAVQVGAGISSVLARRLGLSPEKVKALLPVGAAAAIAAAFNTPMAAVLFSLEEIMGDLHAPVLGSVVLASATGVISTLTLEQATARGEGTKQLTEFTSALIFPHVHPGQSLHLALERMGAVGLDVLPVVSRANVRVLEGVVALRDVLGAYGVMEQLSQRPQELPPTPEQQS